MSSASPSCEPHRTVINFADKIWSPREICRCDDFVSHNEADVMCRPSCATPKTTAYDWKDDKVYQHVFAVGSDLAAPKSSTSAEQKGKSRANTDAVSAIINKIHQRRTQTVDTVGKALRICSAVLGTEKRLHTALQTSYRRSQAHQRALDSEGADSSKTVSDGSTKKWLLDAFKRDFPHGSSRLTPKILSDDSLIGYTFAEQVVHDALNAVTEDAYLEYVHTNNNLTDNQKLEIYKAFSPVYRSGTAGPRSHPEHASAIFEKVAERPVTHLHWSDYNGPIRKALGEDTYLQYANMTPTLRWLYNDKPNNALISCLHSSKTAAETGSVQAKDDAVATNKGKQTGSG